MITFHMENVQAVATAAPMMPQIGSASPTTDLDECVSECRQCRYMARW